MRYLCWLIVLLCWPGSVAWADEPDTASDWMTRGWAFLQEKQYDKAIDCYEHAIRLDPSLAKAYYGRGTARGRQRKRSTP